MTVDPTNFRAALGHFATGVAIASTRDAAGGLFGVTVSSLTSVSLDPPLVLFCLDRAAQSFAAFTTSGCFALAVLDDGQQALSRAFAASPREPWAGLDHETRASGAPVIKGMLAWLDCATDAVHAAGDHVILVGRVLALGHAGGGLPLLHWRGRYRKLDGEA